MPSSNPTGKTIVYGAKGGGSVAVEAALELIGLPYEVVDAPTWKGDAQRDRVAPVNPMRQIPALVLPNGEIMTESAAILLWLGATHPEARLAPQVGDATYAQYLRWMVFIPAAIYSMYWVRDDPKRLAQGEEAGKLIRERAAERVADCWRMMEAQTLPQTYVLGEQLSMLDLYITVVSRWTPGRTRFAQEAPRLSAVVERVDAEPRLLEFWERRFPRKLWS